MESTDTLRSKKALLIVNTAEELFNRYGVRRVTIEEICQRAAVSKMTFYKYFSNKEELYKYVMNRWFTESMTKMNELKGMDIPFTEKIRRMMQAKEQALTRLTNDSIADYIDPAPELKEFMAEFYAKGMQLVIDLIRDAQEKGEVREGIRPEFILAMLNHMAELAKDAALLSLYPSAKDYYLEINNFFFCGILPMGTMERAID